MDLKCTFCSGNNKLRPCTGCNKAFYCGKECQTKDWVEGHKQICVDAPLKRLRRKKTNWEGLLPKLFLSLMGYMDSLVLIRQNATKLSLVDLDQLSENTKSSALQLQKITSTVKDIIKMHRTIRLEFLKTANIVNTIEDMLNTYTKDAVSYFLSLVGLVPSPDYLYEERLPLTLLNTFSELTNMTIAEEVRQLFFGETPQSMPSIMTYAYDTLEDPPKTSKLAIEKKKTERMAKRIGRSIDDNLELKEKEFKKIQ